MAVSALRRNMMRQPNQMSGGAQTAMMMDANQQRPQLGGLRQPAQQMVNTAAPDQQSMQPAPTSGSQNFGLAGQEAALQGGMNAGIGALQQGTQQGLNLLEGAGNYGINQLQQGTQNAQSQLQQGRDASNIDPNTGQPLFQQAANNLGGYASGGLDAQQQQLALSGSQGQDAFNNALINNPGTKYLQDEMMRNVTNQASATGNVISGNVLRELQDRSAGIASQDLNNQFNRASQTASQGLQAAGQQGNFLSQAGQQQGNLASQNSANMANSFGQGANFAQQSGQNLSGLAQNLGGAGASMINNAGINSANIYGTTGQQMGSARGQAGRDLASQISSTSQGLAGMQQDQGIGLESILSQGGGNISDLIANYGQLNAAQQQELARMLGNFSIGQGASAGAGQAAIGQAQAGGIIGRAAGLRGGIGQTAGAIAGGFGAPSGAANTAMGGLSGFFG